MAQHPNMPGMRRSTPVLALLAVGLLALALQAACTLWCFAERQEDRRSMARQAALLGLTDIALFTEARYTRHPSQADLFTPFQDAPASLEHFPTGSLILPPPHLRSGRPAAIRNENEREQP